MIISKLMKKEIILEILIRRDTFLSFEIDNS